MSAGMRKALLAALVLVAMTSVVIVRAMRLAPKNQLLEILRDERVRMSGMQTRSPTPALHTHTHTHTD